MDSTLPEILDTIENDVLDVNDKCNKSSVRHYIMHLMQ